jgi:hypothetical protein
MVVTLSISQHGKSKKDKVASARLVDETGCDEGQASATKKLFKAGDLNEIESQIRIIRAYHNSVTLNWNDASNSRLLPSKKYSEYSLKIDAMINELDKVVSSKASMLTTLLDNAKVSLGTMFDPTNYSTPDKFRDSFRVRKHVTPIPDADDFRVTEHMSPEDIEAIRTNIEKDIAECYAEALKEPWSRLFDMVKEFLEDIKAEKKFHDSKLEHIIELAELLPDLNITNDPNLDKMCRVVIQQLHTMDPKEIRKYDGVEDKEAIDTVETIMEKMTGYMAF